MLITIMNITPTAKSVSEQESARLYLGELVQLSDELAHRSSQLRDDGRRILDAILTSLEARYTSEYGSSESSAKTDRGAFTAVRRELQSNWLRVDSMIDDLLHSAADEIAQFTAVAESQIGGWERAINHRKASRSLHGRAEVAALDFDPG